LLVAMALGVVIGTTRLLDGEARLADAFVGLAISTGLAKTTTA
jgi:hypothetical protein